MPYLLLLKRFWKPIAAAVILAAVVAWVLKYGHDQEKAGEARGRAAVAADWKADTDRRDSVDAAIRAQNAAKEAQATATNTATLRSANEKLQAIAADRTSLSGRLHDYENRLRALTSAKGPDQPGAACPAGVPAGPSEADRLSDEADRAAQRDAVRFSALQDQLKPQL